MAPTAFALAAGLGLLALAQPATVPTPVPSDPRRAERWAACANRKDAYAFDQRLAACTALIDADTRRPSSRALAFFNRSTVHFERGDHEATLADLDESIRINPRYAMAFNNRGRIRFLRGEDAAALADFAEAIRLGPELALPFSNRAAYYRKRGDDARADADFAEARRIRELYGPTYRGRPIARPAQPVAVPAMRCATPRPDSEAPAQEPPLPRC